MTPLPACRHRGPETDPGRVACRSPRVAVLDPARGVPADLCRGCALADHADGPLPVRPAASGRGPCAHVGPATGEAVECPTCEGSVRVKLFACALHGRCTLGKALADGTACCARCLDYTRAAPG